MWVDGSNNLSSDWLNLYWTAAVLKVRTDVFTSITASLKGQAVILVKMYVKTSETDVIVVIGNIIMCLMAHCLIISSIRVNSVILTITLGENKGKMSKIWIILLTSYIKLTLTNGPDFYFGSSKKPTYESLK